MRTAAPVARWTVEQVLALAPDDASRKAGSKLGSAGPWSGGGCDGSGAVWGQCKGSGSKPYVTVIDITGPAYKCSCPSRKFPCKHALGLLLVWASGESALPAGEVPDWAGEWLADRRRRSVEQAEKRAGTDGAPSAGPADPEAARRRAERRAERITGGAKELEERLADLLRGGWRRPISRGTGSGRRRRPAWSTPRRPDWRPGCGSWAPYRRPVRAGKPGCWRSVRCCICWTAHGWGSTGCRSRWRPRSVPGWG